ncbi:MAG: NifU family protein [Euryarchaeota archaeon]|nr:NifU family protein [Euryarchaeota archaeon]
MEVRGTFENIERIIQESIRPVLRADGGDITLVDVKDGVGMSKSEITGQLKKGANTYDE